jgi:drug/metabolite transporter (DMT)-like permease
MDALALLLVLGSALLHAIWNLFAKRVSGGPPFLWLMSTISALIYAPLALLILLIERPVVGVIGIALLAGTSVLHLLYYLLLDRGYRAGDLSLVYPLSRGTGPLLAIVLAVLLLGERPTVIAIWGALLVTLGVVLLTGNPFKWRGSGSHSAIVYGLLTGVVIAGYTITDKIGVSVLLLPPLAYVWAAITNRALLMTLLVRDRWDEVRAVWRDYRRETIIIAILDPLSYILFLIALVFSPVSYLAPARQVSILIGAVMGTRLLAEGRTLPRLGAAAVMLAGLVALALS